MLKILRTSSTIYWSFKTFGNVYSDKDENIKARSTRAFFISKCKVDFAIICIQFNYLFSVLTPKRKQTTKAINSFHGFQ